MDVKWLDDFMALVDCRSFTQAALRRNTSQSGFSRRIQSLEQWVGASLVDREANPLDLTSAGRRFLPIAANLRATLMTARQIGAADTAHSRPALTLAVTQGLQTGILPRLLSRLTDRSFTYPIQIVTLGLQSASAALLDGSVELWLTHQHANWPVLLEPQDFEAMTVARDRLSPVVGVSSAGHALHTLPGTREKPVPLIANGGPDDITQLTHLQPHAYLEPVCTADSVHSMRALVRQGLGVAFVPESMVRDDLRRGELVVADARWGTPLDVRLVRSRSTSARGPAADAAIAIWNMLKGPKTSLQ